MSPKEFPSHASCVVIGGGVMGCSTLYHLAKAGVGDAVLLERNQLTSGTTWHSAAQVRALRSTRNLTELIRYSVSLYSQLEAETGQATGWINKGSLSIATSEDRMTHVRRQDSLARLFGVRTETISAGEAKERWPLMNADDVLGAVWSPDDGARQPFGPLCGPGEGRALPGCSYLREHRRHRPPDRGRQDRGRRERARGHPLRFAGPLHGAMEPGERATGRGRDPGLAL